MDKTLKYAVMGAGVQLGAKSASSLGYYYLKSQGWTDAQINGTFWYWYASVPGVGSMAPSLDDWVLDLGLPAGLFLSGKLMERRKPKTGDMLKGMALGAALTGIGTFLHDLLNRVGPTAFATARIPTGMMTSPYAQATPQSARFAVSPARKGAYR